MYIVWYQVCSNYLNTVGDSSSLALFLVEKTAYCFHCFSSPSFFFLGLRQFNPIQSNQIQFSWGPDSLCLCLCVVCTFSFLFVLVLFDPECWMFDVWLLRGQTWRGKIGFHFILLFSLLSTKIHSLCLILISKELVESKIKIKIKININITSNIKLQRQRQRQIK